MVLLQITPMDWSASIAWIAFFISLIGTIASPLITTWLTNRYNTELRKLDMQHAAQQQYENRRFEAITQFLQKTGSCFSRFDAQDLADCGASFHCVYQFVPTDFWPELDKLYNAIIEEDWTVSKMLYPPIARRLSEILKEAPQEHQ